MNLPVCVYNSEHFAQRQQNFARAHARVPVTFRNSADNYFALHLGVPNNCKITLICSCHTNWVQFVVWNIKMEWNQVVRDTKMELNLVVWDAEMYSI